MQFGNYTFHCRFQSDAGLPYFKGSTFRGVFGRALKQVVCALKSRECGDCMLNRNCVYALVFEALRNPAGSGLRTGTPHPFVIEPPITDETQFGAGSDFDFNLLLFGEFNNSFPYFFYALEQMGKIGIGRRINGTRGIYNLETVALDQAPIYSYPERVLNLPDRFPSLRVSTPVISDRVYRITVELETPLRLKFENRLTAELPFHVLVRALLRRISSLMTAYGNGEPDLDYRGMVHRAQQVRTVASDLKWFDWRRYSFRQDKGMLMGGMTGSVTYEGRLEEYLELPQLGSKVHIGKQTAFGLGKFSWRRV